MLGFSQLKVETDVTAGGIDLVYLNGQNVCSIHKSCRVHVELPPGCFICAANYFTGPGVVINRTAGHITTHYFGAVKVNHRPIITYES